MELVIRRKSKRRWRMTVIFGDGYNPCRCGLHLSYRETSSGTGQSGRKAMAGEHGTSVRDL